MRGLARLGPLLLLATLAPAARAQQAGAGAAPGIQHYCENQSNYCRQRYACTVTSDERSRQALDTAACRACDQELARCLRPPGTSTERTRRRAHPARVRRSPAADERTGTAATDAYGHTPRPDRRRVRLDPYGERSGTSGTSGTSSRPGTTSPSDRREAPGSSSSSPSR